MSKELMNDLIEKLRPIVETAEGHQNLVLGAFVYWVVEMIKGSDNPEGTLQSIKELIDHGVMEA